MPLAFFGTIRDHFYRLSCSAASFHYFSDKLCCKRWTRRYIWHFNYAQTNKYSFVNKCWSHRSSGWGNNLTRHSRVIGAAYWESERARRDKFQIKFTPKFNYVKSVSRVKSVKLTLRRIMPSYTGIYSIKGFQDRISFRQKFRSIIHLF